MRTQSRTLAAMRDALLPKLLCGELRVPSQGFGKASVLAEMNDLQV